MVRLVMIDGSPEEVVTVAKGLEKSDVAGTVQTPAAPPAEIDPDDKVFASTEVARRVFNRRPLSPEQKAVLKTLSDAYPEWVPAAKLHAATGYTPAQFAGLMGAFGRRFTHTEGFVSNSWLFDAEWNYERGAYDYKLPETVLEAVKVEHVI